MLVRGCSSDRAGGGRERGSGALARRLPRRAAACSSHVASRSSTGERETSRHIAVDLAQARTRSGSSLRFCRRKGN
jgi:hypothetical protein